ncbi:MAG: non-canonical purine NTP pyrophosphatase, RdgB/HAM1 family [Ignavibacteria bacterium]
MSGPTLHTNRLVLATHNKHKAEELQAMLRDAGIDVLALDAFPGVGAIEEDQETLEGNARKKAREVFRQTALAALADDTGLEVDALGGKPGVHSSRFAGPNASYTENVTTLLQELSGIPPERRTARFRCVLAFVAADGVEHVVEGVCHGRILEQPRGEGGFGYDPIFLPQGYDLSFAEMPMELKNTISHRAQALKKMRQVLLEYFGRERR